MSAKVRWGIILVGEVSLVVAALVTNNAMAWSGAIFCGAIFWHEISQYARQRSINAKIDQLHR